MGGLWDRFSKLGEPRPSLLRRALTRLGAELDCVHRAGDLGVIAVGNLDLRRYRAPPDNLPAEVMRRRKLFQALPGNRIFRGEEFRAWLLRDAERAVLGSKAGRGASRYIFGGWIAFATGKQRNTHGGAQNSRLPIPAFHGEPGNTQALDGMGRPSFEPAGLGWQLQVPSPRVLA
jgi:hypothetical protein